MPSLSDGQKGSRKRIVIKKNYTYWTGTYSGLMIGKVSEIYEKLTNSQRILGVF